MAIHKWPGLKTKKRRLKDLETEEISLVDRAANKKKFAIIKAAAADEDGPTIERILEAFLGPDYPGADLSAFKQSVANIDEFFDTVPENLKESIKVLVWCVLEAMAGGFELKEADETADAADAVDEGKNGKGKNGGIKKGAALFPTLSATPFMKNFMFGSRVEKWLLEEALQKSAGDDDDAEPEPVRRSPVRKSLTVDDVPDDEEDESGRTERPFIIPGLGVTPTLKKKAVKKSADVQDDDDKILWPSLGGGQN